MAESSEALRRLGLPLQSTCPIQLRAFPAPPAHGGQSGGTAPSGPTRDSPAEIREARPGPAGPDLDAESLEHVKARMEEAVAELGLTAALLPVDPHPPYYEQSLEWRRDRLGASSVEELCKSVVMENTKLEGDADGRVRSVLVVVQYVAKLHKEKLIKVVQAMEAERGLPALGKKQYNMRLLEGAACQAITGCGHNAVTPLKQDLPMILSDAITKLPSGQFWLGGGHVDLKLRLQVEEAIRVMKMTVADVTA
ncbi:unnamed protein product [Symbiodinium sp. CCMP2592]|nr:unnamed protein product [Symbiodinium sp. CCMP2592]